jgi:hypothetical protein
MGLFGWLKGSDGGANHKIRAWRREWSRAAAAADAQAITSLRSALKAQPPMAPDLELEEEMLDGLERLVALVGDLEVSRLPQVETSHRVVGSDVCHYSAPASMPEDPLQPSGRLLLTATRAVFIGGPKLTALAWHAAGQAVHGDRDLLLVRADGTAAYRFRCNSYADALCGAAIARHLMHSARRRQTNGDRAL